MTPELTSNIAVLANRFPEIVEELKTQLGSVPHADTYRTFIEKSYGVDDKVALIHRWVARAPQDDLRIIVTTGFGDGSHVQTLLDHSPQTSRVCVVDCDSANLLYQFNQIDYSKLLGDPRFILITPFCYREIINRLNIEMIGIQSSATFLYAPIYNQNPQLYQNVLGTVLRQLTIRWNQIKTDVEAAEITFENSIKNFNQIGFGSEIMSLHSLFKDKPLVLVGAGPSLDESFDFLRSVQGKAVIAVVNSAYRTVINQGIRPDITVAVDPREGTYKGYQGTDTSHPFLICTYIVYPEVPPLFENRVFPLTSYNYLMELLRQVLGLQKELGIVGDGTVSSTVVNLAALFGCNEIYLVGQDMAIRTTGQTHTKDSFYTDENLNHHDLSTCKWVMGNNGEQVPVEAKLHAYLKIFENQVSSMSTTKFYNLSKHGAQIHGATYLSLEKASEKLKEFPSCDFHSAIAEKAATQQLPENVTKAAIYFFEKHHAYLEQILDALMKFSVKSELAIELHDMSIQELKSTTHAIGTSHSTIIKLFEEFPLFTSLLVEGRSKREYFDFISSGEPWSLLSNEKAPLKEMLPQAWALVEGAIFQIEILTNQLLKQ